MGSVLSDDVINTINNASPANNLTQLGTLIDNALGALLPVGSISTAEIADSAITADKIASNAVTNAKLADNAVTTAEIADNAVTNAKIADNAITTAEIGTGAVTTDELGANAVTTAKEVATPFIASGVLTAAAAATPVVLLPDASVPVGKKCYVTGILLSVNGATAWTDSSGTGVIIEDTNGSPLIVTTIAKAGLTGEALFNTLGGANQVIGANIETGAGLTEAKGIQIVADSNFDAGSDIAVTVFGIIK